MGLSKLPAIVKTHVLYNMTNQVLREFKEQTDVGDEIEDFVGIASRERGREITVYEWWLVSNDFAYAAKEEGEIIVDTPFGAIWGRQYNGPLIAMDLCVESILKAIGEI